MHPWIPVFTGMTQALGGNDEELASSVKNTVNSKVKTY